MKDQHSLQAESTLDRYKIIRVLGEGGFGITYLAEDIELGLKVVVKEYFPNEFAIRTEYSTITVKSKSEKAFSKGKQRFKEEAQTLAKFNHPSIVKILGYFETNDTAYFVMEYEEGNDLSEYLKYVNKALNQEEILSIIMPILEGLKEVHKYNYLHRDIKPGNILLRKTKAPVLIDFGASKLALGEVSKSITSMLTEGYAPLEQYSTDIKQQGAFTDIYAVSAVIYKMIIGKVPPSAQTRSYALLSGNEDPYISLLTLNLTQYEDSFLKAIDRALNINANNRPQSVQEFQSDLAGELEVNKVAFKSQNTNIKKIKKEIISQKQNLKNNNIYVSLFIILLLGVGGYAFFRQSTNIDEIPKRKENTESKVRQLQIEQDKKIILSRRKIEKQRIELEHLAKLKKVQFDSVLRKFKNDIKVVKETKSKTSELPTHQYYNASSLYKKCIRCHGRRGKIKALGESKLIANENKNDIIEKLMGYKNGTLNQYGLGLLMKGQMKSLTNKDIEKLAEYISKF